MRKPDFFIVGAPKCGTTALYSYLKQHPEIYMARKELHYFGADLTLRDHKKRLQFREYLDAFSMVKHEKRVGEASVWYLYSKTAAEEIEELTPDAKIIVMLRNPVDMLYSQYFQLRLNGDEDLPTFEQALDAEEDRKMWQRLPKTSAPGPIEALYYIDTVKFAEQVQRYFTVFSREKVHVIIYDDFAKDTASVYRDTLDFLGVNRDFQPTFAVVNPCKKVRNIVLWRIMKFSPYRLQAAWRKLLPPPVRGLILKNVTQWNTKHEARPAMTQETHEHLQKILAPNVECLSKLLGRDLTYWTKESNYYRQRR
ncbi:MAG: sulfotransferase [Deltaproteobacteria bacterium]|nr:sulfotransferase [Deltaproteobacteria bacterium]